MCTWRAPAITSAGRDCVWLILAVSAAALPEFLHCAYILGGTADLKADSRSFSGCRTPCLHFSWNSYASDRRTRVLWKKKKKIASPHFIWHLRFLNRASRVSDPNRAGLSQPQCSLSSLWKFPEGSWNRSENLIVTKNILFFLKRNMFTRQNALSLLKYSQN